MTVRIRRKIFDDRCDMRPAIHWLRTNGVDRNRVAHIFRESGNYVSVADHNEREAASRREGVVSHLPIFDFTLVESDVSVDRENPYADREESIEEQASQFWRLVRGLRGLPELGRALTKISKPGKESYELMRLEARVKHLTAEMYLHAGYAKTSLKFCARAIRIHNRIFRQTRSRLDLERFAKTCLLAASAHIMRDELGAAEHELDAAENAFSVANVPVDPELFRQRAALAARHGEEDNARALYRIAFDKFLAHREYLGYGAEEYARHDAGKRPLSLLDKDFHAAQRNLEVSSAWPAGDIHRSMNLNSAIAVAFQTDSSSAQNEALNMLPRAREAAEGYGKQAATVRLLELTPQIPGELHARWTVFALQYNAYRNK